MDRRSASTRRGSGKLSVALGGTDRGPAAAAIALTEQGFLLTNHRFIPEIHPRRLLPGGLGGVFGE